MIISKDAVLDLEWWRDNIIFASKCLQHSKVIYTDVSNVGLGASCKGISMGEPQLLEQKWWHINALELESHTPRFEILHKRGENSH